MGGQCCKNFPRGQSSGISFSKFVNSSEFKQYQKMAADMGCELACLNMPASFELVFRNALGKDCYHMKMFEGFDKQQLIYCRAWIEDCLDVMKLRGSISI